MSGQVTAYQISFKGCKLLEYLPVESRQAVDHYIFAPSQASANEFGADFSANLDDLLKVTQYSKGLANP